MTFCFWGGFAPSTIKDGAFYFLEPLLSAIGSRVDVGDSPSNLARVLHIQGAQF